MASLRNLISEVKDPNDYDGALFVCTKEGRIANIGFTGSLPSGIDQKTFAYRLLMEAGYAIAFGPEEASNSESDPTEH